MPLIKVQTSVTNIEKSQGEKLLKTLSGKLSHHLGKPESYVMTALETNIPMTFGGTTEPVCYIEIKNLGQMSPQQTKSMSADFCQVIEEELKVAPNRTYIEFTDAQRHLWGWNKSTF